MTQRDLAVALGREHGMVARIELGERRVDFVEAYQIFVALGANPNIEADSLMTKFAASVAAISDNGTHFTQRTERKYSIR
jgi:transcriptional regulator with XRE-family HTH domain